MTNHGRLAVREGVITEKQTVGTGEENMNILVINCGSSSLKYQLIDSEKKAVLAKGLCERIGIEGHQPSENGRREGKILRAHGKSY